MINTKVKVFIFLLIILFALSYFFYSDLSASSGPNLKQFLAIFLFTLAGGFTPIIEAIFFTSQQKISVIMAYPIIALVTSGSFIILYVKWKKNIWLIVGGTIWLLFGSIYIGVVST